MEIDIERIKPSPYQPRTVFELEELKESISYNGLLMPLTVREVEDYYELIDGDRRLRALKSLGMKTALCSVIVANNTLARKMVWKINIDRADYTVEEKARFLKKLNDSGMTFYQIGKELNEDDQWVLANINIFEFSIDIQQAVWCGKLTVAHIRELSSIIGAGQTDVAEKDLREAIDRKLTRDEFRVVVKPQTDKIEEQRLEAAKTAIGQITDIGARAPNSVTTLELDLKTPEGLENTAKILKQKAKKEREAKLTPEERKKQIEDKSKGDAERKQKQRERDEKIKEEAKAEGIKIATKEMIKQNPIIIQEAINDIVTEMKTEPSTIALVPEEIKKLEEYQQHQQTFEAAIDKTKVMRNKNWLAHGQIMTMADNLRCPYCGKGIEELIWKCCGISVAESYKKLKGEK